jgi:hypothetical protein
MESTVTGVFEHNSAANDAVNALTEAGIGRDAIHVIPAVDPELRKADRRRDPQSSERALIDPQNGAALGFVAGFFGGGLLGLLLATGNLTIMGMGPAMQAGPFVASVVGAAVLGLAGYVLGWIFNAPLPNLDEATPAPVPGFESLAYPHRGTVETTIVHVVVEKEREQEVKAVLERFKTHANAGVWHRTDHSWEPA